MHPLLSSADDLPSSCFAGEEDRALHQAAA